MPAFTSSSLYLPISARSSSLGMTPASLSALALTITMNRIGISFVLVVGSRSFIPALQGRRTRRAEIDTPRQIFWRFFCRAQAGGRSGLGQLALEPVEHLQPARMCADLLGESLGDGLGLGGRGLPTLLGQGDGNDGFPRPVRVHAGFGGFDEIALFVRDGHGEDEPLRRGDLAVDAPAPAVVTSRWANAGVEGAPFADLDLAEGDLTAMRREPARQVHGVGPGREHQLAGRVEVTRDEDLVVRGVRHRIIVRDHLMPPGLAAL